jgi:hypothetical protein
MANISMSTINMAKKSIPATHLVLDRVLLLALLTAATGYIIRGTYPAMFFDAAGFILGVIWSFRAITTNPSQQLRMLAALILVMLGALLAFALGSSRGLL